MKLKYKVCDFSKPNPAGKLFRKEDMERILASKDFQTRMASHDLIGTISHEFRWTNELTNIKNAREKTGMPALPQSDLLMARDLAANCTENLWIEGDELFAEIQVLESQSPGKRIRKLIDEDKVYPDISMVVVETIENDKKYQGIADFLGIDFTFQPALDTQLLATYSKENSYLNFMYESEVDRKDVVEVKCYSKCLGEVNEVAPIEPEVHEEPKGELECYSIREFIRVRNRKPIQALMMIITDIKNYINATKPELLIQVKDLVMEYLTSYLFKKITEILSDPETKTVNLNLVLGLNRFCDSKAMMEFQRVANLVLRQKRSMGFIDKRSQVLLAKATTDLISSILDFILKAVPEDKKEIFTGKKSKGNESNPSKESSNDNK